MESTILLIDDDVNLLRGLCRTLRHEPYRVLTARDAEEALGIVQAWPIDLVLSDENLPGSSGTELLAWMVEHCPDIVRITLTGNVTPEMEMRALHTGCVFRFLTKPVSPTRLAEAIRDGLALRQQSAPDAPSLTSYQP